MIISTHDAKLMSMHLMNAPAHLFKMTIANKNRSTVSCDDLKMNVIGF